jgi:hypothetical protein
MAGRKFGIWERLVRRAFVGDERGEIKSIVKLAIGAIVAAAILPTAIENVSSVSTTGWDQSAAALWPLIPIFIVLSIALVFIKEVLKKL